MIVGVPKETFPGERLVALVPPIVPSLNRSKIEVAIEKGAGQEAGFPDAAYEQRGARLVADRAELFKLAEVILQVRGLGRNPASGRADLERLRPGQSVIGLLEPLMAPETVQELAQCGVTAFAMELMPRITRAQPMDALSSLATLAGYKAVLLAANAFPGLFPMMMTAAGTIAPARVFVVGAAVAGLQAIATAHRLGAVVQAYDIRPAVKEQVESVGAKFVELPLEAKDAETSGGYARAMDESFYQRQRELMAQVVTESDVVITTAVVPGAKAPVLITAEMVKGMRPGSVIVDQAAWRGGNCELTRPGETVVVHGVTIMGPVSLASLVPHPASQMYAKNISSFLLNMVKNGQLELRLEDEIIRETLVTQGGQVVHPQVRERLHLPPLTPAKT